MLFDITPEQWLAFAAVVTAGMGAFSTIISLRRTSKQAKDKANEECVQRLRDTRKESEDLAHALHELRMARYNYQSNDDPSGRLKDMDDILERWSHLE